MLLDVIDRLVLARVASLTVEKDCGLAWQKAKPSPTPSECEEGHSSLVSIEEIHPKLQLVQCAACKRWLLNLVLPEKKT